MADANIEIGDGFTPTPRIRRSYPFDSLKKKGQYFVVTDLDADDSLRSQAAKQGKRRGIVFRVEKTTNVNGAERPKPVLVVCHNGSVKPPKRR